jgi:hypothetical protein
MLGDFWLCIDFSHNWEMMLREDFHMRLSKFSLKLALGACALMAGTVVSAHAEGGRSVELILDASGSMRARLPDGKLKIDAAKASVAQLLATLPADTRLAFRAYGHQSPESAKNCQDTALLNGFDTIANSKGAIVANANGLDPRGYTPITYVLQLAAQDLVQEEGREHAVVLVSDGKETCQSDPCGAAKALADSDTKLVIHTVGAGVDNETRTQLECIAKVGRGKYFDAKDSTQLTTVMAEAAVTKAQPIAEETPKVSVTAVKSDKSASTDKNAPTALGLGEIVKGRVDSAMKHYWQIQAPTGKYLVIYDARTATKEEDIISSQVNIVQKNSTNEEYLVGLNVLDYRVRKTATIDTSKNPNPILQVDGNRVLDYWLLVMPLDGTFPVPYFAHTPSVTPLEIGKTVSISLVEEDSEAWYSVNLKAGDYKIAGNFKNDGVKILHAEIDLFGVFGEANDTKRLCKASSGGKEAQCEGKIVLARDTKVLLRVTGSGKTDANFTFTREADD